MGNSFLIGAFCRYRRLEFYKLPYLKYLFLVGVFLFLSSCIPVIAPIANPNHQPSYGPPAPPPDYEPSPEPPPDTRDDTQKQSDPVKQGECYRIGRGNCEGNEDCEKICDGIFKRRANRQKCYDFSADLVNDFSALISATKKGDIEDIGDIGSDVLDCLLDIDEKTFTQAMRRMGRRDSKEFAMLIVENEDFAKVIEEEDDEFNILRQMLYEITGGSELTRALSREVDDGKTFLWLAAEGNEYVWKWLDNYVEDECDREGSSDCPGGENIGAYCNALQNSRYSLRDWREFLEDTGLFADEYETEVEDDYNFEYSITNSPSRGFYGDFRDFCSAKVSGWSGVVTYPGNCPNTPEFYAFTFESGPNDGKTLYRDFNSRIGIAYPENQNIIAKIDLSGSAGCSQCRISLRADAIDYASDRNYYIYIKSDGNHTERITFTRSFENDGLVHSTALDTARSNFVKPNTDEIQVAVAAEYDNQCVFYLP